MSGGVLGVAGGGAGGRSMVYDPSSLERCEKARVVRTGWNEGNASEERRGWGFVFLSIAEFQPLFDGH